MSHAFLFVPFDETAPSEPTFRQGVQALESFKQVRISDEATSAMASLAVAPAAKSQSMGITRSADGQVWIADFGMWLPVPAKSGCDATWLIEQYLAHGVESLAQRVQGMFVLVVVDLRQRRVHVITDQCGSIHVYCRKLADGYAVSLSSAALAMLGKGQLDPVAVHEFIATGIIYEDRSLWQGISKIGPATVLTLGGGESRSRCYWQFSEVRPESLGLSEAVARTHHALVSVLKALPLADVPLVSDLTGGYDSRFLLSGLLEADRSFTTTVSGATGHPDVVVAGRIADEMGLQHQHIRSNPVPTPEEFDAALRMTDGEYDAFDYARILATHRRLSAGHSMSLNGSFGELARGYWWELLWPRLGQRKTLDVTMVARRRFAAIGYDKSIFAPNAQLDLAEHMAAVAGRAIAPLAGFPNTTQMDCVYYTLRMQRWQGRITSATNQLWPAFSPIGFIEVLDPILSAKAASRFRSLFVRDTFARYTPRLARIPLEHGYPPMPATLLNIGQFSPLAAYYGSKVWKKVVSRLPFKRSPVANQGQEGRTGIDGERFMQASGIGAWIESPRLSGKGLFQPEALSHFLKKDIASKYYNEQWRRLITLEALLRHIEG